MKYFLSLIVFAPAAFCQTAQITGIITDSTNAAMPNARITALNSQTGVSRATVSNGQGGYSIPLLNPGAYELTVRADGFKPVTRAGLTLEVDQVARLDFTMEVGSMSETVGITAAAPILESETSSGGQVIDNSTIVSLPLNGRNYLQLGNLTAGTVPATRSRDRTFIANGNRGTQNSFLIDGTNNVSSVRGLDNRQRDIVRPSVDAIGEFKVLTSTFSAEYGQSAGAVVIATIKSGTNVIHGSAFEFLRNTQLDAIPYFQLANTPRPLFLRNQFGGSLGGPVIKQHLFLFGAWESTRIRNQNPLTSSVPLAPLRAGDFGGSNVIFDPATLHLDASGKQVRDPFPNNVIPQNRFDPIVAPLVNLWPLPNGPGSARNYGFNPRNSDDTNKFDGRMDYTISSRNAVFARGDYSNEPETTGNSLPPPAESVIVETVATRGLTAGYTATLTPRAINELRFGYTWVSVDQNALDPRNELGIPGSLAPEVSSSAPTINITGYNGLGVGNNNVPIAKTTRNLEISDSLAWQRGAHFLRFGFSLEMLRPNTLAAINGRSTIAFTGVFSQDPQNRATTGDPFADFLLGLSNSATLGTVANVQEASRRYNFFVQDDWHITRKLTLNLGGRYEISDPFWEVHNHQANFILEPSDPAYGMFVLAGAAGRPQGLVARDMDNFAPRLGLAYQVTPNWVVRAGAGIFYGQDESWGISGRITNNPPFVVNASINSDQINTSSALNLGTGFPPGFVDPTKAPNPNINDNPQNWPRPYVSQWTMNIQRSLPKGIVVQAAYVGSAGMKLVGGRNANAPPPGPGAINPRRPFPLWGNINRLEPRVRSSYEGMNLQAEKRFASGLSFLTAFTWGHSIDLLSAANVGEADGGAATVQPQNPYNVNAERASSDFDIQKRFTSSLIYDLPFGRARPYLQRGIAAKALGGWSINSIITLQTGLPFTVIDSFDPTNTGTTARPDRLRDGGLPSSQQSINQWFDVTAFAVSGPFLFGNAGRNILRAPGLSNLDLGVFRRFALLRESRYVEFRCEMFNTTNTPHFDVPNATIGTAAAGKIFATTTDMREIQLALKLVF